MLRPLGELFEQMKELKNSSWKNKDDVLSLVEKTINCFLPITRGAFDLTESQRKQIEKPQEETEILINELDPEKIQQLLDMGFSQSDSVDALLQFS
jgi:hypothetical protein